MWNQFVDYHATHTLTQFPAKMQLYTQFFKNNILNSGDNVQWTAMGWADKMGFDQEPYFDFKDINLIASSKKDSFEVADISGRYYPSRLKFNAKGGKVFWDRAGLDLSVRATLQESEIDLRYPWLWMPPIHARKGRTGCCSLW